MIIKLSPEDVKGLRTVKLVEQSQLEAYTQQGWRLIGALEVEQMYSSPVVGYNITGQQTQITKTTLVYFMIGESEEKTESREVEALRKQVEGLSQCRVTDSHRVAELEGELKKTKADLGQRERELEVEKASKKSAQDTRTATEHLNKSLAQTALVLERKVRLLTKYYGERAVNEVLVSEDAVDILKVKTEKEEIPF